MNIFIFFLYKLYNAIIKSRLFLYRKNFLKTKKLPCFVISIGNITPGGTGKTPAAIYLADFFKSVCLKPVVLSRGYKGKGEKKGGIVSDGEEILANPEFSGDEPYMMAETLKNVPVLIGKNRFAMGMKAVELFSPDVIILDDGFQHIKLERDIDILLLDTKNPFGGTNLPRSGFLREPLSSIERADMIIFTRSDSEENFQKSLSILKKYIKKDIPIFKSVHVPYLKQIVGEKNSNLDLTVLKDKKIIAFSGIAKNDNFKYALEKTGAHVLKFFNFRDHHHYIKADIEKILAEAKLLNASYIATTYKDFVKIKDMYDKNEALPLAVIDVRISSDYEAIKAYFTKFIQIL